MHINKINKIKLFDPTRTIFFFLPFFLIFFWVLFKDYNWYPDWDIKYIDLFIALKYLNLYVFDKDLIYCADPSIKFINDCSDFFYVSKISRLIYIFTVHFSFLLILFYLKYFIFNTNSLNHESKNFILKMKNGVFLSLTFPSIFYFLTDSTNEIIVYYLFFLSIIFYRTFIFFPLCLLAFLIDDNNTKILILFLIFEKFFYYINKKKGNGIYFLTLIFALIVCFLHSTSILYFLDFIYSDRKISAILNGFEFVNQEIPLIARLIYFFVSLLYYDPEQHIFNRFFLISTFITIISLIIYNHKNILSKINFYLKINTYKNSNLIITDNYFSHLFICSIFFTLCLISLLPTHAFAKYYIYIYPIFFAFLNVFYDKRKILLVNMLLTLVFICTF